MSDTVEMREYVSRYSGSTTGIVLHKGGVPTDSEAPVTVDMVRADDHNVAVFTARPTSHVGPGVYEVDLTTAHSGTPDEYDLVWHFTYDGVAATVQTFIEVGQSAPAYDAFDPDIRGLVENVNWRFADLFDSVAGGPHLQVYYQAHFGRNRLAQIMNSAVGMLNTMAQPHMTYGLADPGKFPVAKWGPLLEYMTYIETLKHLIRSYTEQPEWPGVNIARADRRDYMQRWREVLDMEREGLTGMLDVFKIAHMGLSRPGVLVAGGVYGNFGPTRMVGSAALRPRYWARFF